MGSLHGSRAASEPHSFLATTMKLFGLLSFVAATLGMNLKEPVVNEVIDMVESGLGESKEGRALFITLTLTQSTWSVVSTVTTDLTTATSCLSASVTECAAARSSLQKDVSNGPAILTLGRRLTCTLSSRRRQRPCSTGWTLMASSMNTTTQSAREASASER